MKKEDLRVGMKIRFGSGDIRRITAIGEDYYLFKKTSYPDLEYIEALKLLDPFEPVVDTIMLYRYTYQSLDGFIHQSVYTSESFSSPLHNFKLLKTETKEIDYQKED